eukprot:TRINITY_DN1466_c0_g1_i9.p1 TRINITY_DN1466_c0_g1~~TRINITY_DN1466_c0_g1_i9.p1  ORF type:complete len:173 (-),score=52.30 TRINITY_DN1466_c0_g1_i9:107-625(-)
MYIFSNHHRNTIRIEREYKGVIVYEDGSVFEGHFSNGLENGTGRRVFRNLEVFEGEYDDGVRNGEGKYYYSNGNIYQGGWKENKKDGDGKLEVPGKGVWEGTWVNDKQDGVFTLTKDGVVITKAQWNDGVLIGTLDEDGGLVPPKEGQEDLPGSFVLMQKLSPQNPVEVTDQ